MERFLVNSEEPKRGNEKDIRKFLKSLYKDNIIEIALQFRYERNIYQDEYEKLKEELKQMRGVIPE